MCVAELALLAALATAQEPREPLRIAGLSAAAGTRVQGHVEVPAGVDAGTALPVTLLHGAAPGPVLLLVAGIHGCEYAPMLALQRLAARLDPAALHGSVVLVHLANPLAFQARTVYLGPDGKNLNRVFPGRPDGTHCERIAHVLMSELVARADCVVDLHAGDANELLVPYVTYVAEDELDPPVVARSRALAQAFGFERIKENHGRSRDPSAAVFLSNAAFLAGKATIAVESGELGRTEEEDVLRIERGVERLLHHLELLPGALPPPPPARVVHGDTSVKSPHTGFLRRHVEPGEEVRAGQKLATVSDPFGAPLAEVHAPFDGLVLYVVATPPIRAGETIASVARLGSKP